MAAGAEPCLCPGQARTLLGPTVQAGKRSQSIPKSKPAGKVVGCRRDESGQVPDGGQHSELMI